MKFKTFFFVSDKCDMKIKQINKNCKQILSLSYAIKAKNVSGIWLLVVTEINCEMN